MPVSGRRLAVVALVVTMIVWGSSFVVTKLVLDEAGPFAVTVLRFGFGLSVLLPFTRQRGFRLRLALEPAFLLFGLTASPRSTGCRPWRWSSPPPRTPRLSQPGCPRWRPFWRGRSSRSAYRRPASLGIGLSVLGIGLLGGATPSGADPSGTVLLGKALMVGAVVAYGAYAVQGRALRGVGGYPAIVATAASFAAGLLFLLPLAAGEAILFDAPDLGPRGWLVVAYLGAAASALPIFLWNYALGHVTASAAALYINLVPVVGLGSALLFVERVGAAQFVGGGPDRGSVRTARPRPRPPRLVRTWGQSPPRSGRL